jgi:signal transduction histidine kinase/CheY-like chemotaxis protein/HPt (histidine-containing phosphotransfer) domain-containing protein
METLHAPKAINRSSLLVFFGAMILIGLSGYGYFIHVKRIILEEKQIELATIAQLKAEQIFQWRKERLGDGVSIHSNAMIADRLREYLNDSAVPSGLEEFKVWMEALRTVYGYRSAALYKIDGGLLVSAFDGGKQQDLFSRRMVEETLRKPEVLFSDFHRAEDEDEIHLNLVIPVGHASEKRFKTLAVLVLDIDPHQFLYQLVNSWPTKNISAETILVERRGDEAVVLNDVRHQAGTAPKMRTALTDRDSPIVKAVLGQEVVLEGNDYRGISVLYATRSIPGSPWAIVVKVDAAEVYGPIKTRAYWVILFALFLACATTLGYHLLRQKTLELQMREKLNEDNSALEAKVEERTVDLLMERNNLKGILDALYNCVYIVNQQLQIEYANPALLREFGPVNGRTCHAYLHGTDGSCDWCNNMEVFTGQMVHREWTSNLSGKTYSTFDTPYKNAEGKICKLAILHDVTAQKISEKIIKNHSEELEQRVIERTRALENANYELIVINEELELRRSELGVALIAAEQGTRAKSEFLSNMSHEIRTPLNAIIGFSTLTLKSSLPPRQREYVQIIHTAGESLLHIINDILDFSKIEAGQLKMEQIPFILNSVLENVNSMLKQKAVDKGLNTDITILPNVDSCLLGDPHRLSQILVNLMSNAVKFTDQGEVSLEIEQLNQRKGQVQLRFSVHDSGIGLSPEQINSLFQPFSQADGSTTRRFGGTGLGLSISKQLVELMGGTIWCESALGMGSIFSFTAWFGTCQESDFAQYSTASDPNQNEIESSFDFSGFRILLVEDNVINQQLAIELLKDTGAEVHLANNGKEAVFMITGGEARYDLVLMDIQMPVMDGYEATRLIRSDSRFLHLPIIAMTAHALLEEQQKILQAGIDAHISKPIDSRTMLQLMKFFLDEQTSSAQLVKVHENETGDEQAIPEIAGLDVSSALRRLSGKKGLYLMVLRSFVENQADSAIEVEEALRVEDTDLAVRLAHTVSGIAGTIGATLLQGLARTLEIAIRYNEPSEKVRTHIIPFAAELERLVTELKNHLNIVAEIGGDFQSDPVNVAVVTPVLNRLLGYINGRNGKAERYLDDYSKELAGLEIIDIEQIKAYLKKFEFAQAREALLSLSAKNVIILSSNSIEDYQL